MKTAQIIRAAVTQTLLDNALANYDTRLLVTFTVEDIVERYGLHREVMYPKRGYRYPVNVLAQMVRNELHRRWANFDCFQLEVDGVLMREGRNVAWVNPSTTVFRHYKGAELVESPRPNHQP